MEKTQGLNKHHRILVTQIAFWTVVIVNFVIRKIPVSSFDSVPGKVGIALLVLGALLRSWAAGYLNKGKALATHGPYAISRNPLYLGAGIMTAGMIFLIPDVFTALVVIGVFIGPYYVTIRSEEEFLRGRFGQQWDKYAAATSRVLAFRPDCWRRAFVPGWSFARWRQNRGWGVYLGIVVFLSVLWVYGTYLQKSG